MEESIMSVMDKLINAMKFNDDPYEDENEIEENDYYEDPVEDTSEPVFEKEEDEMEDYESTQAARNPR